MEQAVQQKKENTQEDDLPEKIPFRMGDKLQIRPLADTSLKAQAQILGVIPNIAILVDDPDFSKNEQIEGRVGGDIICAYFLDGYLFKFKSRFGQILLHEVVCIDYPKNFECKKLRQYPRIKVDLEAESSIGNEGRLMNGYISDISQGGCCFNLPGVIALPIGTPVNITFVMPNDESVENILCMVMNVRQDQASKTTVVGLAFEGPASELFKVKRFCDMCQYFRV